MQMQMQRGPERKRKTHLVSLHVSLELRHRSVAADPQLFVPSATNSTKRQRDERCREEVRFRSEGRRTSFATVVINFSSCEMIITPPFHWLSANINASRPSRSRWLVGYSPTSHNELVSEKVGGKVYKGRREEERTSSRSRICGCCSESTENATRDF